MPTRRISNEFKPLEKLINQRLKEFGEDFVLRHLAQGADGKFRFELSVAIDNDQGQTLQRVLREVLKGLPTDKVIQAKFYLPESLAIKVKKAAQKQKISQSALVAQCLNRAL